MRAVALAIFAAGLAAFEIAYVRLRGFLIDDVFISVRYAGNLVAGHGLVYNVGERVEGYTNFLWTLLLTPPLAAGLPVIAWIKGMNAVWAVVAGALVVRTAWLFPTGPEGARPGGTRVLPETWLVPALAGALSFASPSFILSAAEGLETMMFTALLLLVVTCTWAAREHERIPPAALAVVALGLTRPDGWAYLPWLVFAARLRGLSWAWCRRAALVIIAGFALREVARLLVYGDFLPNTLHAKSGGSGFLLDRGWTQLGEFVRASGGWLWLLALLPLAFAPARRGALALLAAIAVRLAFQLWSGGPWMGRGRFLTPILPLVIVLMVQGVTLLLRGGARRAIGLALLAILLLVPAWRRYERVQFQSVAYGAHLRAAHARLGADVAAYTTPDAVMAMSDAGIGPLAAGRTNIDLLGLNDRHLGRLPGSFAEKADPQYVFDRNPDLVVLVARRPPPIAAGDLLVLSEVPVFTDPLFAQRYRFAREYRFDPDYFLLLYARSDSPRVRPEIWVSSPPARP
jgi:arabinofuranosyltransferase